MTVDDPRLAAVAEAIDNEWGFPVEVNHWLASTAVAALDTWDREHQRTPDWLIKVKDHWSGVFDLDGNPVGWSECYRVRPGAAS